MYKPVDNRNAISIDEARKIIVDNIDSVKLTTEKIAATSESYTGQYLGPIMARDRQRAGVTK